MRISWVTKTFRRVVRFFRGWRCVEKGLGLDKNISKKVYGVKGRLFLQNTKTSHRNIQYSSYLLSKCLGNLFSVSPQRQRPKYKVFFCGYQLWRRQFGGFSSANIYLISQVLLHGLLHFLLISYWNVYMCCLYNLQYSFFVLISVGTPTVWEIIFNKSMHLIV